MVKLFKNSIKELKQYLTHSECLVSGRPLLTFVVSLPAETLGQPNETDSRFQVHTVLVYYSVSLNMIYPLP